MTNYAYYTDKAVTSAGQDISYLESVSRHTSPSLENWLQFTFLQVTYLKFILKLTSYTHTKTFLTIYGSQGLQFCQGLKHLDLYTRFWLQNKQDASSTNN